MARRQVDRLVGGLRVRFSTRARTASEHRYRLALVDKLVRLGALDTLTLLRDGALAWETVLQADREGRLGRVASDLQLTEPIGPTADRLFRHGQGEQSATERRYRVSIMALLRETGLRPSAPVARLRTVSWELLAERWPGSADDWMHCRRAVSRLLTLLVGKQHPHRQELMALIPTKIAAPRTVPITLADLPGLLERMSEADGRQVRCLVANGLRSGEWERLRPDHLAGGYVLAVPGSKTQRAVRSFPVAPAVHHVTVAAVTDRRSAWQVRTALQRACRSAGLPRAWLHDLRHLGAQAAELAGWPDGVVNYWLGHAPTITQRYTRRPPTPAEAEALARVLAPILPGVRAIGQQRAPGESRSHRAG